MASVVERPRAQSVPSPSIPWIGLAWFFALLVVIYAPVLNRLINQWNSDEDMGHGFFVPVIAAYIAWQRRAEVLALTPKPSWWGLAIVLLSGIQLYVATVGAELFLTRTAFLEALVGCILFFGGWAYLRVLAFPLLLLIFMVPIPAIVYNQITFPLQLLASQLAEQILSIAGVPVLREGNILELPSQRLNVVEACSGIRSLLSLTFLSLVYSYFFDKKVWMRWVLLLAVIPVAIIANAARVTLTGILSEIDPALAEGFFHSASGWVIFMVALGIMVIIHQVINRLYRIARPEAAA